MFNDTDNDVTEEYRWAIFSVNFWPSSVLGINWVFTVTYNVNTTHCKIRRISVAYKFIIESKTSKHKIGILNFVRYSTRNIDKTVKNKYISMEGPSDFYLFLVSVRHRVLASISLKIVFCSRIRICTLLKSIREVLFQISP